VYPARTLVTACLRPAAAARGDPRSRPHAHAPAGPVRELYPRDRARPRQHHHPDQPGPV